MPGRARPVVQTPPPLNRAASYVSAPSVNRHTPTKPSQERKGGRGKCVACASPDREEIDKALVGGESFRVVAKRFGMTATSLVRHKRDHITPALVNVRNRRVEEGARKLIDRLEDMAHQSEHILDLAIEAKNTTAAMAAIRTTLATYELLGKVTGELNDRPQVSVNLQQSSEWQQIRGVIMELFAKHPELKREASRRLRVLDGEVG